LGECIAVLSGKGGTGKTSVCAAVCTAMARDGYKVLAIDCDVGLQNLDISLGMSDSGALSFLDVCGGDYDLSQAAVHPQYPNLHFLTAPANRSADHVDQDAFGSLIARARQEYEYIFLDAPAGIDSGFQLAARFAQRIIVVTLADPAAVRDAARTGQVLELMGKHDVRVVVNRVNKKIFSTMSVTVDDVMDTTGLPLLGVVPEDPNVTLAAAFGHPLIQYTNRGAAKVCSAIARRIQGLSVPLSM
jgi:septum site-determining protein MinD